jgi:hypothetical protein
MTVAADHNSALTNAVSTAYQFSSHLTANTPRLHDKDPLFDAAQGDDRRLLQIADHINKLCGRNVQLLNMTTCGTYIYHREIKFMNRHHDMTRNFK